MLSRIVKNVEKCSEMVAELNNCANQIKQANEVVVQAAELSVKYRKNVLYNLEASELIKDDK